MAPYIAHIDDDADFRTAVKNILENSGFEVTSFERVELFMRTLDTRKPDLVIFDVMIEHDDSGLIGFDAMRHACPEVPIVMLSALGETILPYFEGRNEVVTVLEKPVLPEHLVSVIRSNLAARKVPTTKPREP